MLGSFRAINAGVVKKIPATYDDETVLICEAIRAGGMGYTCSAVPTYQLPSSTA